MTHRILVTGASGFIGKALVPALVARGHRVRAAARRHQTSFAEVESVDLPDLTRPFDWSPLVAGNTVVVHLAGIAHRKSSAGEQQSANRDAVAALAGSCKAMGVHRLILISSIGAQVGNACAHIVTEAAPAEPVSDYGRAKLGAEDAVRAANVGYTILRPVLVYGPNPVANIAKLLRLAQLPLPLPFGSLQSRRSLLAIDNLVEAILTCLDGEQTRDQTFVVSDPAPIAFSDLMKVLRRAQGRAPNLLPVPPSLIKAACLAVGQAKLWDQIGRDLVVDPQKLLRAGWRPPLNTEQGLVRMVQDGAIRRG